ncbi:hypothetical protein K7J14_08665 [Treponema zuelzerae]|uniref:Uncharacterized protein n=1 Tax=Teretinema zuelzerae TaxID=156 RepID=A0AAE3EHG4_9SPIR|nr:hypothetical protein [Teretinema zuelzerae]MCD1654774.1 hypothetical protein [Teretinema zuelzerae]
MVACSLMSGMVERFLSITEANIADKPLHPSIFQDVKSRCPPPSYGKRGIMRSIADIQGVEAQEQQTPISETSGLPHFEHISVWLPKNDFDAALSIMDCLHEAHNGSP